MKIGDVKIGDVRKKVNNLAIILVNSTNEKVIYFFTDVPLIPFHLLFYVI